MKACLGAEAQRQHVDGLWVQFSLVGMNYFNSIVFALASAALSFAIKHAMSRKAESR